MKNKKKLSIMTSAVIGMFFTNYANAFVVDMWKRALDTGNVSSFFYAGGTTSFYFDALRESLGAQRPGPNISYADQWKLGYGSAYPDLPNVPDFITNPARQQLYINEPGTLEEINLKDALTDHVNMPSGLVLSNTETIYTVKVNLKNKIQNYDAKYGKTFGPLVVTLKATKDLKSGSTTWVANIKSDIEDPAAGFNGKNFFKSRPVSYNNGNIYSAKKFWEISLPIQYGVAMGVDGVTFPVNITSYKHSVSTLNKTYSQQFTSQDAIKVDQPINSGMYTTPMNLVKINPTKFINLNGEAALTLDAYDSQQNTKKKSVVASNLRLTKFNGSQGMMDLPSLGAAGFMGPLNKSGMYISNTTVDLNSIDKLPPLMQQYYPEQEISYTVEGSRVGIDHILSIELSAFVWTGNVNYYPNGVKPPESTLTSKKLRLFIKVPNKI